MKIALISYEYPPDTAIGGIATYVHQISNVLSLRGHHVEVFCGSPYRSLSYEEDGIWVHRVQDKRGPAFSDAIGEVFLERHRSIGFEVLEGPEFSACAAGAVNRVPNIPLVARLHTPTFLVKKTNFLELSSVAKLRWVAGALRRGQLPSSFPRLQYDPDCDAERAYTLKADEIATPSQSLGDKLVNAWFLPEEKLSTIPYPYVPSQALLDIPPDTNTNTVTFIGRLEIRKGVLDLAKAIPTILQRRPNTHFRFVGPALPSPDKKLNMREYLEKKLKRYLKNLEFTGGVSPDQIPSILSKTDICVFPSRWENFPNVCLEAMSAARGVIGSHAGGMAEMLCSENVGRLIPPNNSHKIAQTVIELLENPHIRIQLGKSARARVLSEYSPERVGELQEECYRRAIKQRHLAGTRVF